MKESVKKVIYPNIESERIQIGITKSKLASEIGITSRTYYSYIHGEQAIPSPVLIKLSKRFNCSVDYLLS